MYSYHEVNFGDVTRWRVVKTDEQRRIVESRSFGTEEECKKFIEEKNGELHSS